MGKSSNLLLSCLWLEPVGLGTSGEQRAVGWLCTPACTHGLGVAMGGEEHLMSTSLQSHGDIVASLGEDSHGEPHVLWVPSNLQDSVLVTSPHVLPPRRCWARATQRRGR